MPGPVHLFIEIVISEARRKNTKDRLLTSKGFRVSQEFDHRTRRRTALLNRQNDTLRLTHETKKVLQHPSGRIGLRDKLHQVTTLEENFRADQHRVISGLVEMVARQDHRSA